MKDIALQAVVFAQNGLLGSCNELELPNCGDQAGLDDILGIISLVTGALSVIFILIGGFKFVVSGGDPQNVKSARETILYAVIGLLVSIFAFTLVNFVAGQL